MSQPPGQSPHGPDGGEPQPFPGQPPEPQQQSSPGSAPYGYPQQQPGPPPQFGQQPYGQAPVGQQPLPGRQPFPGRPPAGQQPYGQSPYDQPPLGPQPYGQQPLGQRQFAQQPIGQQPFGQQQFGQRPTRNKVPWILGGAGALVVVIFLVTAFLWPAFLIKSDEQKLNDAAQQFTADVNAKNFRSVQSNACPEYRAKVAKDYDIINPTDPNSKKVKSLNFQVRRTTFTGEDQAKVTVHFQIASTSGENATNNASLPFKKIDGDWTLCGTPLMLN